MTKEEIIQFLKESLEVTVRTDYYDNTITIRLVLCGEEISRDSDSVNVRTNED